MRKKQRGSEPSGDGIEVVAPTGSAADPWARPDPETTDSYSALMERRAAEARTASGGRAQWTPPATPRWSATQSPPSATPATGRSSPWAPDPASIMAAPAASPVVAPPRSGVHVLLAVVAVVVIVIMLGGVVAGVLVVRSQPAPVAAPVTMAPTAGDGDVGSGAGPARPLAPVPTAPPGPTVTAPPQVVMGVPGPWQTWTSADGAMHAELPGVPNEVTSPATCTTGVHEAVVSDGPSAYELVYGEISGCDTATTAQFLESRIRTGTKGATRSFESRVDGPNIRIDYLVDAGGTLSGSGRILVGPTRFELVMAAGTRDDPADFDRFAGSVPPVS